VQSYFIDEDLASPTTNLYAGNQLAALAILRNEYERSPVADSLQVTKSLLKRVFPGSLRCELLRHLRATGGGQSESAEAMPLLREARAASQKAGE